MIFGFGPFLLDTDRGLFRNQALLHLPPKELRLLELLAALNGRIASHRAIEDAVWPHQEVSYSSISRCIYSLRRALGAEGRAVIETVPKRGYRLGVAVRSFEPSAQETAAAQSLSKVPLAHAHYIEGWHAGNLSDPEAQARAVHWFEQATTVDPAFAAGYAAIADTVMYQVIRGFLRPAEALSRGLASCKRALDANPRLVQGLAAQAWFQGVMQGLHASALRLLNTAQAIDPNYPRTFIYRSWVYRAMGEGGKAIDSARQAMELDPHSLLNRHSYCWALFLGGKAAEALSVEGALCDEYPQDEIARGYFSTFAAYLGHREQALESAERALRLSHDVPSTLAAMAWVMARTGQPDQALQLVHRAETARESLAPSALVAPVYAELGDAERALSLLRSVRSGGCPWFATARLDPRLSTLLTRKAFARLYAG